MGDAPYGGTRKWGPRKSKSGDIGAFTARKEAGIKKAQDQKAVSISVNAAVRDASALSTTLVARGEYEILGMNKGFDLKKYFEFMSGLADLFEKFTDERLASATKEYLEGTVIERERKKDQHQEVKEGVMADAALGAAEEML